ncbi:MAG: hypothetical protein V1820_00005, partial [archaeon]
MSLDKAQFEQAIKSLAQKYKVLGPKTHSEDEVCRTFLLPLFTALGWDTANPEEFPGQVSKAEGRPDYVPMLDGKIAFFLEAKKLRPLTDEDVKQALNYGRNAGKRWAVLSNFLETKILICDTKETSLLRHVFKAIKFEDLEAGRLDDILLLSKENCLTGELDKRAETDGRVKMSVQIGEELLDDILTWRKKLIYSIKEENPGNTLSSEDLEEIAQIILNRIIFIRTVEDRQHEAKPNETLKEIVAAYDANPSISIAQKVNQLFREYDQIYDSKLFTYDESDPAKRHECERVKIANGTYRQILKGTYDKSELYSY